MLGFVNRMRRIIIDQKTCYSKRNSQLMSQVSHDFDENPLIPGLPDDVAQHCLALVPRSNFPYMGSVCKKWRFFIQSKEFITLRKLAGIQEEWLYVLTTNAKGRENTWEVMDCFGHKHRCLPPMPGPMKSEFGVVVVGGKLLIMGGYYTEDGLRVVSPAVYQYDSCLNSWSRLSDMKMARYDFACAEVNGQVYAVGGYKQDSLSSVEMYDPDDNKWTLIASLRRPRWGCFAYSLNDKLYIMGGRTSFTFGNSKVIYVYNPERCAWHEIRNGLTMVTTHAILDKKLFCMNWKNPGSLLVLDPETNSWTMVALPLSASASTWFQLGVLGGKLLLFSLREVTGCPTLMYDPNAKPGSEWMASEIKLSGACLYSVTITHE